MNILKNICIFLGNFFLNFIILYIAYIIIINIISLVMFYIDKQRAINHRWRISETALLTSAFIGGSLGAIIGMKVFRHKTKHPKFYILVPLFLAIHIALIIMGIIGIFI